MLGLIRKHIYCAKLLLFALILLDTLFFGVILLMHEIMPDNEIYLLIMIKAYFCFLIALNPVLFESNKNFEQFQATLPITKQDVVSSKYIFFVLVLSLYVITTAILSAFTCFLKPQTDIQMIII